MWAACSGGGDMGGENVIGELNPEQWPPCGGGEVMLGVVFPDPPKNASLDGVPELGLCNASLVDLVEGFRRKMSLSDDASGPPPADDDFRLFELENRKLPRVKPPNSWLDSTEGGRPESGCPDRSRRRNPHRDEASEPSDSFRFRPRRMLLVRLKFLSHRCHFR